MKLPPPDTSLPWTIRTLQDLVTNITVDLEDDRGSSIQLTSEDEVQHRFYLKLLPLLMDTSPADVARLRSLQVIIEMWLAGEPSAWARESMRGVIWYLEHRVIPAASR